MSLAPRRWPDGKPVWLLLAVILAHALVPFGSPARAASGSAFSAFTSDVSLGPSRAAAPEKERKYQNASGAGTDHPDGQARALFVHSPFLVQLRRLVAAAALPAAPALRPDRFLAHSFGARAPPLP